MQNGKAPMISAFLSLTLLTSQAAEPADQGGGVPRLDARVGTLEVTVAEQGTVGAELQVTVDDLQSQLSTVNNDLLTLENKLMFAVVEADGTLRASRNVQSAAQSVDGAGNPLTGHYDVVFSRNVSLCAATVTAEPSSSSGIVASLNGTFRGSPIHNPNRFIIVLSDTDNNRVNGRFNIIVMC